MAYNINITEEAQEDLNQIFDYISKHFLASQAATNTLENIRLTILKLEEFPEIGVDVSERLKKKFSDEVKLRMLITGHYLVFYIFENSTITILRVLYQKRNFIEIFS
ncbi:MAG: type II toxin-antitoxin system RelE/ParE family toxin [Lactobacillales bacterium]|jgi:toxin ParE1/3/4|nr:type II toxin-antitoxin system RelE/ParE family toxin [Lactobacillales bacterium]